METKETSAGHREQSGQAPGEPLIRWCKGVQMGALSLALDSWGEKNSSDTFVLTSVGHERGAHFGGS